MQSFPIRGVVNINRDGSVDQHFRLLATEQGAPLGSQVKKLIKRNDIDFHPSRRYMSSSFISSQISAIQKGKGLRSSQDEPNIWSDEAQAALQTWLLKPYTGKKQLPQSDRSSTTSSSDSDSDSDRDSDLEALYSDHLAATQAAFED